MRVRKWHYLGTVLGLGSALKRDSNALVVMLEN